MEKNQGKESITTIQVVNTRANGRRIRKEDME